MTRLDTLYRYWITLLFAAVVAQIGGAAYGAFYSAQKLADQTGPDDRRVIDETAFEHGFSFHTAFGYLIFVGAVALLLIAVGARLGKTTTLVALAVTVAVAVQIVLAWMSESVHAIGFLHGVNALVVFGLTGYLSAQAWKPGDRVSSKHTGT
jgi:hypothetical protein